jgi:3-oxoacyl-[acyl-carrier-protein] synthase II
VTRRVVITGVGLVTPVGLTVDETWTNLLAGTSGAAPITKFDASNQSVRFACEVKGFDPSPYIDRKEARRYDLFAQFGLAAAHQSMVQAGLDGGVAVPDRAGVIIGSGIGGMQTFQDNCEAYLLKGPDRVSPFFVPMFIPDIAAGLASIRYNMRGANFATVSACASGAHAIGTSWQLVRNGLADVMLTGGCEAAITGLSVAAFANMKALSTRNDEPQRASRPFDRDRDGFVLADGAGMMVLEEYEHAKARGATILGEMVGYGASGDAFHITSPPADGHGAMAAMQRCLESGSFGLEEVDYINAHGTSTPQGDVAETNAVKQVFGTRASELVFASTKSMTGHALGAAGAIEAVISLLVARTGDLPPTINVDHPDPACDLDCVPNVRQHRPIRVAMSNSFGFGGHNATIAVRAV